MVLSPKILLPQTACIYCVHTHRSHSGQTCIDVWNSLWRLGRGQGTRSLPRWIVATLSFNVMGAVEKVGCKRPWRDRAWPRHTHPMPGYLVLIEFSFVLVFCLWSYIPQPPLHLFWGSWLGPLPYRIEANFLNRGPILLSCGLLRFWVWYGMICVRQTGRGQGTRVLPTKHGETVRDQDTRTPCPYQWFYLAISEMPILVTTYYVWGDLRADP